MFFAGDFLLSIIFFKETGSMDGALWGELIFGLRGFVWIVGLFGERSIFVKPADGLLNIFGAGFGIFEH